MKYIDLHIHTKASDGGLSPTQVVELAIKKGMKAIAITDHDTVSGIPEALLACENKPIQLVQGIELSCHEPGLKGTIDVLGLFIDYQSKSFVDFIQRCRNDRVAEKQEMIRKLNALGYAITFEELKDASGESLGRPGIARLLIEKYPEEFMMVSDVFDRLLGEGKAAYVHRKKTNIKEAIDIIHEAKGVTVLAHPGRYKDYTRVIDVFVRSGGEGIETDYPYGKILGIDSSKSARLNMELCAIAHRRNLLMSGGSDFHDFKRKSELGDGGVNDEEFDQLSQGILRP